MHFFIEILFLLVSINKMTLGTTYALFVAGADNSANVDVSVQLSDSAALTFTQEDNLIIEAGLSNLGEEGGHLSASNTSTATLKSYDSYIAGGRTFAASNRTKW